MPCSTSAAWLGMTCLTLCLAAQEAEEVKRREGHSLHGESFNEGPRQSGHLMHGQGAIDFPITTKSGEVQALVNQGVGQLHGFFYFEAERSFRQAATIEPECPMLYWGMAMANTNNEARAKGFLKAAHHKEKAIPLTRRETLYLAVLDAKYKEGGDDKGRRQGWLRAIETLNQEFPDDLDARAWLVLATWENSRRDGIGSRQVVSSLLDSIIERQPLHPGAHHYKIHLWDGFNQQQAERSARLYARSQPGIAHAWHMPGHTYTGLKRYADAAFQQEGSARVDHAYMKRDRVMPFLIHNYAHNNQWLAESLTRVGQPRKAIEVARNLVEQPRDPKRNEPKNGGSAQRSGRQRWLQALTTFELWDELLAAAESGALDWSDLPYERLQRAYAIGQAYAGKGDRDGLTRQIAAVRALSEVEVDADEAANLESNRKDRGQPDPTGKEEADKPQDKDRKEEAKQSKTEEGKDAASPVEKPTTGTEKKSEEKKKPRIPGLENALAHLEGAELLLKGDPAGAVERFKKAGAASKADLARAQLAANQLDDAVKTATERADGATGEVVPLATLVEALAGAGKTTEARDAYNRLVPVARDAEADLPVMRRLARLVEQWKAADGWTPIASPGPTDHAALGRVPIESVGPLNWEPTPAEPFEVLDETGRTHVLADYRGKTLLLVFSLGGSCVHCMQQLATFSEHLEPLRERGVEVLAVTTNTADEIRTFKADPAAKLGMPIVADPGLALFRTYRAYDDFEQQPMHGTFLIDAHGHVRYQDVAHEPFLDVEFLEQEAARVTRLLATNNRPAAALALPTLPESPIDAADGR